MDHSFLIVAFVLFVAVLLFFWWSSNYVKNTSKELFVDLSTEDNFMKRWLDERMTGKRKFNVKTPGQMAAYVVEKLTGKEIPPENLAIGKNLYEKHFKKFGKKVDPQNFIDLGAILGLDYQIIIMNSKKSAKALIESHDYGQIYTLLEDSSLSSEILRFMKSIMELRWKKVQSIFGDVPMTGSYLYLPKHFKFPKVQGKKTALGIRYNLTTFDREYDLFVQRAQENVKRVVMKN